MAGLRRWLGGTVRAPVVHFWVAGLAIFAVHHWTGRDDRARTDRRIVLTARHRDARWAYHRVVNGRDPTPGEDKQLRHEGIEDEVLYREALALGLDREDPVVRQRLILLMRFLLEDRVSIPDPSPEELARYYVAHSARYLLPARFDVEHLFFRSGEGAGSLAAKALADLQAMPEGATMPLRGDPFILGPRLQGRTEAELTEAFGSELATALAEAPAGAWSGPLASSYGLHVVRVTRTEAARLPALAEVRDRVQGDWIRDERERLNERELSRVRERYAISEKEEAR